MNKLRPIAELPQAEVDMNNKYYVVVIFYEGVFQIQEAADFSQMRRFCKKAGRARGVKHVFGKTPMERDVQSLTGVYE